MAKLSILLASCALLCIATKPSSALTLPIPANNAPVVMDQCVCTCPSSSNHALQNPGAQQVQVASNSRRKRQVADYESLYRSSRMADDRDKRWISLVTSMVGGLIQQGMKSSSSSDSDSSPRGGGDVDNSNHNYL